ncbi:hypothetical protein Trydic_g10458 [Trypoxylus dichotomus]
MAEELNTTKDIIHEILTKDFNKQTVCGRFVPHALTVDQKITRVEHSKDFIGTTRRNLTYLESIVTGDEIWCFKYDPQGKRQSATWKSSGSLKSGQNVTDEYYAGVMERLWKTIVRVSSAGKLVMLHDNVPPKQVCVLQPPPCSPDLSPCDYVLFLKPKLTMKKTFYDIVGRVQEVITRICEVFPRNDLKESMLSLVECAQSCIDGEQV